MNRCLTLLTFLVCFGAQAQALTPLNSSGDIFGLPDGAYHGAGTLEDPTGWLPDLAFVSVRTLRAGVIVARSEATLWGVGVASARARLQVVPLANDEFELLDLDAGNQVAGSGHCDSHACQFKVTVMRGMLTLEETWVPTAEGFQLRHASQNFKGVRSKYEAEFAR